MRLARALLLTLLCLLGCATTARADSVVPPSPVIEQAVPYASTLYVAGSSEATSSVEIYSGATCESVGDPATRHFLGYASPGLDGSWSVSFYQGNWGDTVAIAIAERNSGPSEPSACTAIQSPPTIQAPPGRMVDDHDAYIQVEFKRSAADGDSTVEVDTVEGSAHEYDDYSPVHETVYFGPGEHTASVGVRLTRSEPAGTRLTFTVRVHDGRGAKVVEPSTAAYTIRGTTRPRVGVGGHLNDFGAVATSNAQGRTTHLTLYSADVPATVKRITLQGSPAFDIPRNGCRVGSRIDGRRGCDIYVRFRPRARGRFQASLVIETDAPTETVPYIGTGGRVGYACTDDYEYPVERDPRNPLMLPNHGRTSPDPLTGSKFFVDSESGLGVADLKRLRARKRLREARLLQRITTQPETKRFSRFTRTGGYRSVRQLMCRVPVQHPGSIPLLSLYRLEHEHCGHHNGDSPAEQRAYRSFVDDFARGVGRFPVVIFYEFDSLITTPCLNRRGLATRIAELRYGIKVLSKLPHAVVYLDGGAADALPYRRTASLLNRVGLKSIQGFFLNSTHYDWTRNEIAYGQKVSRLVGGKHFVVSTAVNGRGPLKPRARIRAIPFSATHPVAASACARPRTRATHSWTPSPGSAIPAVPAGGATVATFRMGTGTCATHCRWPATPAFERRRNEGWAL